MKWNEIKRRFACVCVYAPNWNGQKQPEQYKHIIHKMCGDQIYFQQQQQPINANERCLFIIMVQPMWHAYVRTDVDTIHNLYRIELTQATISCTFVKCIRYRSNLYRISVTICRLQWFSFFFCFGFCLSFFFFYFEESHKYSSIVIHYTQITTAIEPFEVLLKF